MNLGLFLQIRSRENSLTHLLSQYSSRTERFRFRTCFSSCTTDKNFILLPALWPLGRPTGFSLSRFPSFNMHDNANLLMQWKSRPSLARRGNFSCSMHNLAKVPFMLALLSQPYRPVNFISVPALVGDDCISFRLRLYRMMK